MPSGILHLRSVASEAESALWRELVETCGDLRLQHDPMWVRAVGKVLQSSERDVVLILEGERAVAAIPLFPIASNCANSQARVRGVPLHQHIPLSDLFLGDGRTPVRSDLLDPINTLVSWDKLFFARVPASSHLCSFLAAAGVKSRRTLAGACARADVSSPRALEKLAKENLRNVDRLKRRAIRDFGEVSVEVIEGDSALEAGFERFLAVENAGWKGSEGTRSSLQFDTKGQQFYREVLSSFSREGKARIDILRVDGRDAACHLAVKTARTWSILKIGYHPDFKDVGPGGILLKSFLEEMSVAPEIDEVNLTTNPPWAARWHFDTEPLYHLHVYNGTLRGRLLHAAHCVVDFAKFIRNHYRASRAPAQTP